jgi:hypothetical protein
MHDQRPVGLTPKTAARVIGAARSEERFDRLRYNGSGPAPFRSLPRQRVGWPVRVTGPMSGGTPDLYPGVVLEFDGYLDGAAVWADGVECWVTRLPGAAAELADESEHLGEPVGEHEDKVIFAVGSAGELAVAPPVWDAGRAYGSPFLDASVYNALGGGFRVLVSLTIPSDGEYLLGYTANGVSSVESGTGLVFIQTRLSVIRGGAYVYDGYRGGSAANTLSWGTRSGVGVTYDSAAATVPRTCAAGDVIQLHARKVESGTVSSYVFIPSPADVPPPGVPPHSEPNTRLWYAKLSADPGGVAADPPPPGDTGVLVGKVLVDSAAAASITLTLSGATSGTTTTDATGVFSFPAVNAGSNTVTLTLLPGETCTYQVDSGSVTAGNAAPVTVAAGVTHTVKFEVTSGGGGPDPGTGGGE